VLICKLRLISPIIRRIRSRRNRLLRVRLLGRNPAWIILRIIFAYRDVSLAYLFIYLISFTVRQP
jgi:hypothetical protein